MLDKLRMKVFDEQCCDCGYDIEMQSFVMVNDDCEDKIYCLECYHHFLYKRLINDGWSRKD